MANTLEHETLICLFHHTDRAERTVQELLEIGIPESAITLIGHARETADIATRTATLDTINVPDSDRARLMDGLRAGGSIVAVSTDGSMAGRVEDIFKEYSADKIDEKVRSTPDPETLGLGGTGASAFPGPLADERAELPPVNHVVIMSSRVEEMASESDLLLSSTAADGSVESPIKEVLLVTEPQSGSPDSAEMITLEETVILLEPTDLVEDTDLVEPQSGSSTTSAPPDRFDPEAPIDNVRNPAADRLNDPLNRR